MQALVKRITLRDVLYILFFALFLFLYLILSFNNRPAADDFYFLKNLEDSGWWQSMIISYNSWVTRWSAILFLNVVLYSYKIFQSFLPYHVVTLFVLFLGIKGGSNLLLFNQNISKQSRPLSYLVPTLLLISFFFWAVGVNEIFFWITSTAMYLWSFIALCFATTELFRANIKKTSYFICLISFLFIGGAAEAIAIPSAILLVIFISYRLRQNNFSVKSFLKDKSISLSLFSLAILIVSIYISYSGEGRIHRHSALPHESILNVFKITFKAEAILFVKYIPEKIHWLLLFFFLWIGIGLRHPEIRIPTKAKDLFKGCLLFLLATFLFLFPACYLLGETPPFRAFILVSFLVAIIISYFGIAAGKMLQEKKNLSNLISYVVLMALFFLTSKTLIEQKKITTEYANLYDKREKILMNSTLLDSNTVVEVDKLPPSGMLFSSVISSKTSDFRNQHLKNYYGMRASLRIKE